MDKSDAQETQARDNTVLPYQRLTKGQIRLLTIDQTETEPFRLSLNRHPYDAGLEYDALSYAWNPSDEATGQPQVQVRCNAASFELSSNLYQAIWIDYICIDQTNIEEKEWQLPLMGHYSSRAKMVWIWLGQAHGHTDSAMEAMAGLALKLPTLRVSQPVTDAWRLQNELPLSSDSLWDGIDDIYTREWFNRLWTMQEFVLAAQRTFICGLEVATGAQLVTVAQEFLRLGLVAVSRRGRIPHVGYKDGYHFSTFDSRYREAKDDDGNISLHLALQLGRLKEARNSKQHDRVYALLGLLSPVITARIPISYDLSWWEMYVEVGKVSLKTSEHFDLLTQCQSTGRPKDLPSWCPNFSVENEAALFIYECYFAGYDWDMRCNPHIEFVTEHKSHILVRGASFTTIKSVAKLPEKRDSKQVVLNGRIESLHEISRRMNECLEMAREVIPESYFQPVPEAFLRVLVADVLEGHKTGHSFEV